MTDSAKSRQPELPTDRDSPSEEEEEEDFDGAENLEYGLRIGPHAVARNGFYGNHITVTGNFVGSMDGTRVVVPVADVTASVQEAERTFVEPPSFAGLVAVIREHRMALLTGGGCGNRTAAGVALRATKHGPILELPAGVPVGDLVNSIEEACRKNPEAGILIESVDSETLSGLAGFELRRLLGMLSAKTAIVLTTHTRQLLPSHAGDLHTIEGVAPDAVRVVRAITDERRLATEAVESALMALPLLTPPVSPSTAVELVEAAVTPHDSPEQLAAVVTGQSHALDEWLSERPVAARVASLAAAATLDGVPSPDVETEAARLEHMLEGAVQPSSEPTRFGAADRGWPAGVVGLGRRAVATHFGRQETEVIEICPPHSRDQVVTYLWRELGAAFRGPYLDWLRSLPEHRSRRVRVGGAVTAGVLFLDEPMAAEAELLRPWALDGRPAQRDCAALAFGVPVAIGADPTPARALAAKWATSHDTRLRHVSVVAYGGPLGAWDPGSAAAARLWRISSETPELQRLADQSLASLVVAGRDAGRARATVIGVLLAQDQLRPVPKRVYRLLPRLMRRLTGGSEMARESLAALLDDAERESLVGLATLLARAFDAPTGHESARDAMRLILGALANGQIDREVVNRLIREMKAAALQRGRLAALGSQFERLLQAESRGRGSLREVARSIHTEFYTRA